MVDVNGGVRQRIEVMVGWRGRIEGLRGTLIGVI